jgi:hypothetical protein
MKLRLPCAVLPVDARNAAARRLGIRVDDIVAIAYGELAWRDGQLIDEEQWWEKYPDDDFDAFSGPGVLPADLVTRRIHERARPGALPRRAAADPHRATPRAHHSSPPLPPASNHRT